MISRQLNTQASITESGGSEYLVPCLPYLALKINYDFSYMQQRPGIKDASHKTNQKLEELKLLNEFCSSRRGIII